MEFYILLYNLMMAGIFDFNLWSYEAMADIIAMFSRWAKSGLSAMFSQGVSSFLDGSASSSTEPTRRTTFDDFQRITRMLPRIEAVLEDAEEREIHDRSVNLWLSELRLLAYDIDDVVDEYEYEVLRVQMEATAAEEAYHLGKRKRSDDDHHDEDEQREGLNMLASSSSQVPAISDGMAEKIREIRERFDEIERDRKALRLREEDGARKPVAAYRPQPTSSFVDESSIIGRESDKEKIVELLLSDSESNSSIRVSDKITVIAIVGMGGVGKTTLAQLIYNDPKIHHHFQHRRWISVTEDFDLMRINKEIYKCITKKSMMGGDVGLDYLQYSIKENLMSMQRRIFLVLDDVWNEKQGLFESLQAPLRGADTVKILITTRNKKVADVMRTMNSFNLGFLSKEEGWRLFQQHALCDDENLMEIGKRIVNKCGGLPLAIKLLGSHLRCEGDEDKWLSILESELWDLDPGANEILPALRLSYQRMPIHLKPCFKYFSMFPKNKLVEKNRLVWLWMAQGYIQPRASMTVQETGNAYFDELFGRSFLQVSKFVENCFVMHDLIFDLAVFISGKEFTTINLEGDNQNKCVSDNVRHLVIRDQRVKYKARKGNLVDPFLTRQVALRSIIYYDKNIMNDFQLSDSTRLRALHIEIHEYDSNLLNYIDSITSLKHLRYLCMHIYDSGIWPVKLGFLFNFFNSFNERALHSRSRHYQPRMLPISINNLINLQHLILPFGSFMARGISKLTSLQTLKHVIVNDGSHECCELGEIEDLASLTGSCYISNIKYATDVESVKKANISKKKHIWRLCLDWYCKRDNPSFDVDICFVKNDTVEQQRSDVAEAMLQALQPHNSLKELKIYNYLGIRFPLWLGDPSYSKLRDITLQGCHEWDGSCRVLDRDLPSLQSIFIIDCDKLKKIKIVQSSSLRRLFVENCPELTTLHGLCNLHQLESLEMNRCYNLLISAEERLPSKLQSMCFKECWKLTSLAGLQNLHSLTELKLIKCQKLQLSLEEQLSAMPAVVKIIDCPGLREWCQRYGFEFIQELSNIKELTIHYTDRSIISNYGLGNHVSLETLHINDSYKSDFPKDEWIPCSLYALHLNSCESLKFFPPYQNLSTLRLLKIWRCTALTYLSGLQMMKSLEKLEIVECPNFRLSPVQRLPSKLQYLVIINCPRLFWLHGLQQLFSLRDLRLYGCLLLMLPPVDQLPFMPYVQLEIFNCPKLRDWCRRYNLSYNNKESSKALFARSNQEIKLWHEEAYVFFENIHVLDYDEASLETNEWPAFRVLGFNVCSSVRLVSINFGHNFTRLKQLRIWNCSLLQNLFGLENLTALQDMDISKCPELYYLDCPKKLQSFAIKGCNKIPHLKCWKNYLSSLEISSCSNLKAINGLQQCQATLRFLKISNCPELHLDDELLPDMLHPNNVEISACPQLEEWCQKQNVAFMYI